MGTISNYSSGSGPQPSGTKIEKIVADTTKIKSQWRLSLNPALFFEGVFPKPGAVQPGEGSPVDKCMRGEIPSRCRSGQALRSA